MKGIQRKWLRILIAKYIIYLEVMAYAFVIAVGVGIFLAFWIKVDDTVESKPGELVFVESEVKAPADCIVLRLPAKDMTDVRAGETLAELCDDPGWIARQQAAASIAASLEPLQQRVTSGTATEAERALCAENEARLAAMAGEPPTSVTTIVAPCDGLFALGALKEGAFVAKNARLFAVKDTTTLQANLRVELISQEYCRAGLKAWIQVEPNQTFETLIRLNVTPGWLRSYQHQLSTVVGNDIRAYCEKHLIKRLFEPDGDVAIPATTIQGIDLMIKAPPIRGKGGDLAIKPEAFRAESYEAVVTTGKHTSNIKVTQLPPDDDRAIRELALEGLKKYTIEGEFGPYHVKDFDDFVINVNMLGELVEPNVDLAVNPHGMIPDDLPPLPDVDVSDFVFFSLRKYFFTARLLNPDAQLLERVKALTKEGKTLLVKGQIVVQRRRFAMLLFRSG